MISLNPVDLEALVRRVVREELSRLLGASRESILDDWRHEGPEDPAQDELLLQESLALLRKYENRPDALIDLEDVKQELASAADELPG